MLQTNSGIICSAVITLALTTLAFAGIPQTISYQGYLKDTATGTPVYGTINLAFSLYSSNPSRNNPVWQEPAKPVTVTNGIYSTQIGSASNPITAPFDMPYWLRVNVAGTDLPLQPLSSTGYAFRAGVAESALSVMNPQQYILVQHSGSGSGSVKSAPAGIATPMLALAAFPQGTQVTLTATPDDASSLFTGWTGACSGNGACTITMDALKNVGASFTRPKFTLTTSTTGGGTLISDPLGIYCGVACSGRYDSGTSVTLIPAPDSGLSHRQWSGACSGSGTCTVIMNGNKSVDASFGYLLTTYIAGGDGGTLTSSPSGINCPSTACSYIYNPFTPVALTATPNPGLSFIGWTGGPCSGSAPCFLTMSQAQTVTAAFTAPLNVSRYNNGGGTVSSDTGEISCGSGGACSTSFVYGTSVLLTATPAPGATFNQWTGCDSINANTCRVSMNAVRNVQAKFTYPLTVAKNDASAGTVSGPGQNCGATCSASYGYGDVITFVAAPNAPATLGGWTGCDSVSGTSCNVTANAGRTVTALFAYPVTATKTGTGGGMVTSTPSGISCGATCSSSFNTSTSVTITAIPDPYSSFSAWTGCDSTNGSTCSLSMTSVKSVSALFNYVYFGLAVFFSGDGLGTISLSSVPAQGGMTCDSDCNKNFLRSSQIAITATPDTQSEFLGWSGCDSSSGDTCFVSLLTSRSVTAIFGAIY